MNRARFVLGLVATALAPTGLSGQERDTSPRELVDSLLVEYEAAKQQWEADRAEEQRIRHVWDQLIREHAAAFARDDDDEVRRLRGQLQERTGEKTRAENALQLSREHWFKKGGQLVSALDAYLEVLDQQTRKSVGADDEASRLYTEHEELLQELEHELGSESQEELTLLMPEVEILQGDGPRDIRHKLNLVENRVTQFEGILAGLDREIEALTKRQAREQRRRDREAGGERFDDNANPTGGVRTNLTDDAGVTDSARVTLPVKTLEERIVDKKEYRQLVADYLRDLRALAEKIRGKEGGR